MDIAGDADRLQTLLSSAYDSDTVRRWNVRCLTTACR